MAQKSIAKILKILQLRGVKDMKFSFDPYKDNVRSIREVLFQMHTPKVLSTNQNVNLKIDVKSDRSNPVMHVKFVDGQQLVFKTANLSTLEVLERLNTWCIEKDPKKNEAPSFTTKSAKKR